MQFAQHHISSVPRTPRHTVVALGSYPRNRPLARPRPAPAALAASQSTSAAAVRPLRLLVDRQADGACRLVISGRMADVCAELNRLVLA